MVIPAPAPSDTKDTFLAADAVIFTPDLIVSGPLVAMKVTSQDPTVFNDVSYFEDVGPSVTVLP
jgi:hypothetical protein